MASLLKQHALITGGSRGIGFKIAQKLCGQGCKVTLLSRSKSRLIDTTDYLNESFPLVAGKKHGWVSCDLSDPEHLSERLLSQFEDYKSVNILINCAGQTQQRLLVNTNDATIDAIYKVNLISPTILCHFFSRNMLRQHLENANIVNVSSILAQKYLPGTAVYSASKLALNGLTLSLSQEMNRKGNQIVRVNSILPGLIRETDMGESVNMETMQQYGLDQMTTKAETVANEVLKVVMDSRITGELIQVLAV
ncbi:hypothetical protein FOA43_002444 [Brettanomyces nanus]|uniref:Uncharacterized protein n=1 Tax=Eeniella nana TaxID=13502 RepID=A0A875S2F9_EENNA|nr:uncharacterized protein FOA43_002444 [Brettanomyces nanus]QPG75103.1 hypothetical protein FOA43_002444 [Brettanomyces nanus]